MGFPSPSLATMMVYDRSLSRLGVVLVVSIGSALGSAWGLPRCSAAAPSLFL